MAIRGIAGFFGLSGCAIASVAGLLVSCGDSNAPVAPPPSGDPDHLATFTASPPTLVFRPPTPLGADLHLVVTSISHDAGTVIVAVAIRNVGTRTLLGPDGVAVFDFPAGLVSPGDGALCDPPDTTLAALPASACLFDHRSSYGADGLLFPGETSSSVPWILRAGGDFTFHARPVYAGLAQSGEIAGAIFEDLDADGRRGHEPGIAGAVTVTSTNFDTTLSTIVDGTWDLQVTQPGSYRVTHQPGRNCCPSPASTRSIHIGRRADGSLRGYGRADFGCGAGESTPFVDFLDARAAGDPAIVCATAAPCTLPALRSFRMRLTGSSACGSIAGFSWRGIAAGRDDTEPWQPFGHENAFLQVDRDTLSLSVDGDTLWQVDRQVLTVWIRHSYLDPLPSGVFRFQARVEDSFGRISPRAEKRLVLNFDPDTQILHRAACDCPEPPPGCAPRDSVPIGWIIGFLYSRSRPPEQWIPFCEGDTIPIWSVVQFAARGHDDRRDRPLDPSQGFREARYSFRAEWRAGALTSRNMTWSPPRAAQWLLPPNGAPARAGLVDWPVCPFDYTFFAASVDEHARWDGKPDSMRFFVSGAPGIDSVSCPAVLVLAPSFRRPMAIAPFGRDTLLLEGRHVPDTATPAQTPFRLGFDAFDLPYAAWGRDHPRDRDPRNLHPDYLGSIGAWYVAFDCDDPGCEDLQFPGEHRWVKNDERDDPVGQQYYRVPPIVLPYDTLCVTSPCEFDSVQVVLRPSAASGRYRFHIEARDTEPGETCNDVIDLVPFQAMLSRTMGDAGRKSQPVTRTTTLRLLNEVRPLQGFHKAVD